MGTISSAFGMISNTLDADQAALNIVANNVANANTTGYTVETPNWKENSPIQINGVSYGTGVTETGATSLRDRVLTERLDQQQQLASSSSARLSALNSVQALFTPASGSASSTAGDISSDLTKFFSSFASLEGNPSDSSLRTSVLSSAQTLAGDISNAATSLNAQRSALDQEVAAVPSQVNALTASIAQLNQQISSTSPNADAGQLEDQRQQDLSQLSQLIGINQITTENNGLTITTTSGQALVMGDTSTQLTTGSVGGVTHFFVGTADVTIGLASGGGSLGGYLTARDTDIPSVLSSLDQLAYSVSTAVNSQNDQGTDGTGVAGTQAGATPPQPVSATPLYIFNEPTLNQVAGSALAMTVTMTDSSQIAAAAVNKGPGDSSNASIIAGLSKQSIVSGTQPTDYYSSFVTTLGSIVSQVQTENIGQTASVTQLQSQNNSLSAVNLNDEASAMTTLERSYQAASQVFTMLDKVLASIINLGDQTAVS